MPVMGGPWPLEAKLSVPGFAFASAITSLTVFTGKEGCAASNGGSSVARPIAAKSFCGL